ncbi:MAG: glycosyltransferase [Candidatus Aenigmarchaeota archaeon]|nr:glycosyltransferase [Candidatus Aenigmarchaeota archaeon]
MITVGIAAYNEEKNIKQVIDLWLKEPVDEILIVSSGCTDNTEKIITGIKNKKIKLITESERKGKPSAINKILKHAKGNTIIMTDGDVFPEKGCAIELIQKLGPSVGIVAGRPTPINTKGIYGYWAKISFEEQHKNRLKNCDIELTGNLYALKKGLVQKIPKDILLDDAYIALKIKEQNKKIVYAPNAKVLVKFPTNIKDFLNQKARTRTGWYHLQHDENIKVKRTLKNDTIHAIKTMKNLLTLKGALYLPPFYFLSFVAWLKAWVNFKFKKNHLNVWKSIDSTK